MNKFIMMDIDGTIIPDLDFDNIINTAIVDIGPIEYRNRFITNFRYGLLNFLGKCKLTSSYGTLNNFRDCIREKIDINYVNDYDLSRIIKRYFRLEYELSSNIKTFDSVGNILESLRLNGYKLVIYSNWFEYIQNTKLAKNRH